MNGKPIAAGDRVLVQTADGSEREATVTDPSATPFMGKAAMLVRYDDGTADWCLYADVLRRLETPAESKPPA